MLLREDVAVYCEKYVEFKNTLCVKNEGHFSVKTGGTRGRFNPFILRG
jgi:hypothetical protein